MNDDTILQNIDRLDDLEKELWLLFGNEINDKDRERIETIEDQKDRVLDLWNYIRINQLDDKVFGKEVKPDDIRTVVQNYLRDKKDKSPIKVEITKRLGLYIRTKNPILELPEMVDALLIFGLSKNQAYDYVIEEFGKEMGIDKTIIPKYYEAVNTINTFAKTGKIDVVLSKEVLDIFKLRAIPALVVVKKLGANIEEQKAAFEAVAASVASSDLAYQRIISFPYETLDQLDDPSIQQQFLKHSDPNSLFASVFKYGTNKAGDKVLSPIRDAAVKKFLATEIGKKLVSETAKTTAIKVVGGVALKETVIAALAAIGIAAPPAWVVSAIVFIGSFLVEPIKKVFLKLKDGGKRIVLVSAAAIGGAFTFSLGGISNTLTSISTGLVELVTTEIVTPLIVIIITVPIVIALILFIITNSALVVPYNDSVFNAGFISGSGNSRCGDKPISVSYPSGSNEAVIKAVAIVNSLNQGFWCYWNRSSLFPEYFNEEEFKIGQNHCVYSPNNPPGCVGDFEKLYSDKALFWCTLLIIKSYQAGGFAIKADAFGTENMRNYFMSESRYEANTPGVLGKISPGDAIFLSTGTPGVSGHVALVLNTDNGVVTSIDSNADSQIHHYMARDDGSIQGATGLDVVGFGKLK